MTNSEIRGLIPTYTIKQQQELTGNEGEHSINTQITNKMINRPDECDDYLDKPESNKKHKTESKYNEKMIITEIYCDNVQE